MNTDQPPILSVTQLNQQIKYLLEQSFPLLYIEGEISNLSTPASGHWYFTLKDETAQVRCAMFRGQNSRVSFAVEHGAQVLLKARVSLYFARGDYQLLVEAMEPAGIGKLQRQFEALKNTLQARGWFDEDHKKSLPSMPQAIGIITSSSGAALHDMLRTLHRRGSQASVVIYPTLVQGETAASQIAAMIRTANERKEVDVLLLARGGGSLEDLWAFNEEVVAKAIYDSALPIVTGIGHQVDFTIADFVADLRAATPSTAAELLSPDQSHLNLHIKTLKQHLDSAMWRKLEDLTQHVDWLAQRLKYTHPKVQLQHTQDQLRRCQLNLQASIDNLYTQRQQKLALLARTLQAMSPLNTLARGYSIAKNAKGQVITDSKQLKPDEIIRLKLLKGEVICEVKSTV
ncbi:MAG: exodeoxyribonuclease VII large subunit [Gammaproteobacteria bacterium CG11_big_fil_rev_8_21_14_0_20_46_22]|nr:MAG: exodeoxyribonuclease VII large subunit [Gammaproteobacteria bacterium CG12_big_fil_rev_8_21_14_0_65_46_12]PIR11605.1 MAG: exodeoxyribonuclease VII large subunit [Gammaproteobacteria bacterium CG11_big_fil_rev_8_21_14_0_20_46_22]